MTEEEQTWREYEDELYYDAISGELMVKELVDAARQVEMQTFKKHGAYEKRPIKECWEKTGKAPIGVKRVDTNKGDAENPNIRCRLVGRELAKEKQDDLLPATLCLCAQATWAIKTQCG